MIGLESGKNSGKEDFWKLLWSVRPLDHSSHQGWESQCAHNVVCCRRWGRSWHRLEEGAFRLRCSSTCEQFEEDNEVSWSMLTSQVSSKVYTVHIGLDRWLFWRLCRKLQQGRSEKGGTEQFEPLYSGNGSVDGSVESTNLGPWGDVVYLDSEFLRAIVNFRQILPSSYDVPLLNCAAWKFYITFEGIVYWFSDIIHSGDIHKRSSIVCVEDEDEKGQAQLVFLVVHELAEKLESDLVLIVVQAVVVIEADGWVSGRLKGHLQILRKLRKLPLGERRLKVKTLHEQNWRKKQNSQPGEHFCEQTVSPPALLVWWKEIRLGARPRWAGVRVKLERALSSDVW